MSKLVDVIGKQLVLRAATDERIFVLDGDLADSDGAYHFANALPQRFLMAGIAEQNMISVAAGMAAAGRRPFVFSFAAFLCFRGADSIRVGLSQSEQPVVLVGSHAGGLSGRNGKTHAAPNDMALMMSMPNLAVWAPADHLDINYMVTQLLDSELSAYVRSPRCAIDASDNLPGKAAKFRWLTPQQDVNIVSCGVASQWSLEVVKQLAKQGINLGLLHCLQVNDIDGLKQQLSDVEHLIVIEDHCRFGGLASLIAQLELPLTIKGFGWPLSFSGKSGDDYDIRKAYGMTNKQLSKQVAQYVAVITEKQELV